MAMNRAVKSVEVVFCGTLASPQSMLAYPAYGRRYKSAEQALQDWNNNKDFSALQNGGGMYFSKNDKMAIEALKKDDISIIVLTYDELPGDNMGRLQVRI
jgi:hypothetical protein